MSVLVTGATGALGKEFINQIGDDLQDYFFLVRRGSEHKILDLVEGRKNFHIIEGHLGHPDLFSDTRDGERLRKEVDTVIHLAALYDLAANKNALYKANVIGTQNVLYFCSQCERLEKIIYASTIAVAGNFKGTFAESDFDLNQDFPNPYAKTKFEAESLVRKYSHDHPEKQVSVLRFGIIVGRSTDGHFTKADGPYFFFKNITKLFELAPQLGKIPFVPFPFKGDAVFPLLPVDTAVASLLAVMESKSTGLRTFHVFGKNAPTMKEFLEDFLHVLGPSLKVIPVPRIYGVEKILKPFQIPEAILEYLYIPTTFTHHEVDRLEGELGYEFLSHYNIYKKPLLETAINTYLKNPNSNLKGEHDTEVRV